MARALKHRIIGAGFSALAAARADRWAGGIARGLGLILTCHHVRPARPRPFAPNALLEITPEHLDRTLGLARALGFDFVALDEVPERLRQPRGRFVALTFDDGYRDNVEHAWPILKRHGAPWTMFVTTGFADGTARLWWLELEEAVRRLDRLELDGIARPARTDDEKASTFGQVYRSLRAGPEERLRAVIAGWCEQAGIDGAELVRRECLDWSELATLRRDAVDLAIGAHTLTHPMLAKHDAVTARREVDESRTIIERRLGCPVRHLAYPVGDPGSAGPREFAAAREAGFETAVTTRPGHLFAAHSRHLTALPRVSLNGLFQSDAATRALFSGLPFLLWNRFRRLSVD